MRSDIVLPDPSLVLLVGAAGSGKSTFAARWFRADEILSSDGFRALVGRGEDDQRASRRAFGALHAALAARLGLGRTTVVDATNIVAWARRPLLRVAFATGTPAVGVVLDLPLEDCLAGDLEREGRHVEPAVIERQWTALRVELDRSAMLADEGFAAVHHLPDRASVDAARIVRREPE